jgi:uncharacterized RDD family membrane protein YckC
METPPPPDRPTPDPPSSPPPGPQAPSGPQAPPAGPEGAPSYCGPVPPGGWERPIAHPGAGWQGRPLAGWGSRVGATLIDAVILLVPVILLAVIVIGIAAGSDAGAVVTGLLGFLAYLVVAFLYAPLLMARDGARNGQTWGKQAVGIRVIRNTGEPISFGFAALREIAVKGLAVGIASSILPLIPWLLDVCWPLWDDENRALHDMAVSTHVVEG